MSKRSTRTKSKPKNSELKQQFHSETEREKQEAKERFDKIRERYLQYIDEQIDEYYVTLVPEECRKMNFLQFFEENILGGTKTNNVKAERNTIDNKENTTNVVLPETVVRPSAQPRGRQLNLFTPAGRAVRVPAILHVKSGIENVPATAYRPSRNDEVLFSINGSPVTAAMDGPPTLHQMLVTDVNQLSPVSQQLTNNIKELLARKGIIPEENLREH